MGDAAIPRGPRIYLVLVTALLVGYAAHGVLSDDLVLPATRDAEALHLHGRSTLVALAAVICFCAGLRAAIIDRFVRYRDDARLRYRAATFVLLILGFALMLAAIMPRP